MQLYMTQIIIWLYSNRQVYAIGSRFYVALQQNRNQDEIFNGRAISKKTNNCKDESDARGVLSSIFFIRFYLSHYSIAIEVLAIKTVYTLALSFALC